jgi:hypothetical protein
MQSFYDTWKTYNPVKTNNLITETDKSKTLKKLIDGNTIFKTIYTDKIMKYNTSVRSGYIDHTCDDVTPPPILPILPETYKFYYETDEILFDVI